MDVRRAGHVAERLDTASGPRCTAALRFLKNPHIRASLPWSLQRSAGSLCNAVTGPGRIARPFAAMAVRRSSMTGIPPEEKLTNYSSKLQRSLF